MGKKDEIQNKMQDMKGQAKEKIGKATDQPKMVSDGHSDRAHSAIESVKTSLKEAEEHVKDAIKHVRK